MYKFTLSGAAASVVVLTALFSSPVQATEGYFSHGYGIISRSMGGAGVATGYDAMSQATNPASLTLIENQFTIDMSIFSPHRDSTLAGGNVNPGDYESGRNLFFIPSMAGAYTIDDVSTYGWAFFGNGGMNTTYPADNAAGPCLGGPFCGGKTGVDFAQAYLQLSYARDIIPGISIGGGPVLGAQRFKAFGLSGFDNAGFSENPGSVTDNGYEMSYGYGGMIGVQADLTSGFRFGASYRTRIYMTEFDKYSGLFPDQGDLDAPATAQAGFSWDSGSGVTVALDYKRIFYSDVEAMGSPFSNFLSGGNLLGSDNGPGFGWEDINIYKLGVEVEASPTITIRAGIAINDNPIPEEEVLLNVLAPGIQEQHYTAGLTWQVDANNAVNFGAMYSPENSVTGANPFGGGDITIRMWQWEAGIGWTRTF